MICLQCLCTDLVGVCLLGAAVEGLRMRPGLAMSQVGSARTTGLFCAEVFHSGCLLGEAVQGLRMRPGLAMSQAGSAQC
jgi:hypothetical protein